MKEAYLKAIGTGLQTPLSAIVVETDMSKPGRLITTPDRQAWQLATLSLPTGYVGAVVMASSCRQVVVKNHKWPVP